MHADALEDLQTLSAPFQALDFCFSSSETLLIRERKARPEVGKACSGTEQQQQQQQQHQQDDDSAVAAEVADTWGSRSRDVQVPIISSGPLHGACKVL